MHFTHRQVEFIEAKGNVSRAGEGAFLRLKDSSIMLVYTEYDTADFEDDASAHLSCIYSHDDGETWGPPQIFLDKDEEDLNIMSVSFLRLPQGEILLFYLKKSLKEGKVLCRPFMRRSNDDGKSWSDEICCSKRDSYYVVNNDRVIQLRSGRILMPAAIYEAPKHGASLFPKASICFIASDDNGYTWHEQKEEIQFPDNFPFGPEEPGLYEHEDGTIWCYLRTKLGCQWEITSKDGGKTWSTPRPNMFFSSPHSPLLVKKVCNLTIAVFNPIPNYNGRNKRLWGRTPLLMLVSETDGIGHDQDAFPQPVLLENDPDNDYCYPALLEGDGYFLLAYYHSNGSDCPLNSMKVVKINVENA